MLKQKIGVIVLSLFAVCGAFAQSTSALRINEVLTNNTNNLVDEFNTRGSWIEIYNSSAGTVEFAGCYITTDSLNPKMYMISKGDRATKIAPHQRVLLWADDMAHHGAFHTNFVLDTATVNTIFIYDASGKSIIDKVVVPILGQNKSYGRTVDGGEVMQILDNPTPTAANFVENGNPSVEKFQNNDPFGIAMSFIAMTVVFLALMVLYLVFKYVGKISIFLSKQRTAKVVGGDFSKTGKNQADVTGEIIAAIALALHENEGGTHDMEERVLTIDKVTRNYSPWSSKIYGLREMPHRR